MNEATVIPWCAAWAGALLRASGEGGLVIVLAWAISRTWAALPPSVRCSLWRLAYLKLLLGLVCLPAIRLPLLPPAPAPPVSPAQMPAAPSPTRDLPLTLTRRSLTPSSIPAVPTQSVPPPDSLRGAMPFLCAMWLVGVLVGLGRLRAARRRVAWLRDAGQPVADSEILAVYTALGRRFGLRRLPPLRTVAGLGSPLLLGIRRPVVLLPDFAASESTPEEVRLMLAHELAHLKRRDLPWSLLPLLTHRLFFFHPLVRLAWREWTLAQEIACDSLAIETAEASLTAYGRMVLTMATRPHPPLSPLLAPVVGADAGRTLRRRLSALLHSSSPSRKTTVFAMALLIMLAAGGLTPWRLAARASRAPMPHTVRISSIKSLLPAGMPALTKSHQAKNQGKIGNLGRAKRTPHHAPQSPIVPAAAEPKAPVTEKEMPVKSVRKQVTIGLPALIGLAAAGRVIGAPASVTPPPQPTAQADVAAAEQDLARKNALYRAGAVTAQDVEQAQAAAAEAHARLDTAQHQSQAALQDYQAVVAHRQQELAIANRLYQAGAASADDVGEAQARAAQARVRADLYTLVTIREQALDRVRARYQQGAATAQDVERAVAELRAALANFEAAQQGDRQPPEGSPLLRLPFVSRFFAPQTNRDQPRSSTPMRPESDFTPRGALPPAQR